MKKPAPTCPDFRPRAEAILVKAHHAAPLPPGARVWVDPNGAASGAISMGCVDQDVVDRLKAKLSADAIAEIVTYSEGNEFTGEVGLTCGGRIDVLLRHMPDQDPVYAALADMEDDRAYTLLTALGGPTAGQQRLFPSKGPPIGTLGTSELDDASDSMLIAGAFKPGTRGAEIAGVPCLVEQHEPAPCLLLLGASAIAVHLCRFASHAGYSVTLVDPRKDLAQAARFPDAVSILHDWPDEAFDRLEVDSRWFIAVLAHDLKLDTPALTEALRRKCRYIGLLGSSKTQQKHRDRLLELGFAESEVAAVRGPIGLDIEALTPPEIAISILAELIQRRRTATHSG